MTYQPFLAGLVLMCTIKLSCSVYCNEKTGHICRQSFYVTSLCINPWRCKGVDTVECGKGHCGCGDHYFPTTYGCQERIKPHIASTGRQAISGHDLKISCDHRNDRDFSIATDAYIWYKDGVLLRNETSEFLYRRHLSKKADEGEYRCSMTYGGVEHELSNALHLTIIRNDSGQDSYAKPVLENIPGYYLDGMTIYPTCVSNLATGSGQLRYTFYVDGEPVGIGDNMEGSWRINKTLPKTSSGKIGPLACSYTLGSVTVMSDEVAYPETNKLELAIRGPSYVTVGSNKTWFCATRDELSINRVQNLTVDWFRGGALVSSSPYHNFFRIRNLKAEDAGEYTCSVTRNGIIWTSSQHFVDVVATKIQIVPSTSTDNFQSSLLALECKRISPNRVYLLYNWYRDGKLIKGQIDNILHVHNPGKSEFECRVGSSRNGHVIVDLLATARYHTW